MSSLTLTTNGGRQSQTTHPLNRLTMSGTYLPPITRGLPKVVESICPECNRVIMARMFAEDKQVYMEKTCPNHGYFKELYWSDVELFLKAEKWNFSDGIGLSNPSTDDGIRCPTHCGLCNMHASHTGIGNIDLTNRCNLDCEVCFANANQAGYVYEPTFEQVVQMLKQYRAEQPTRASVVQFAGGEPTIYPRFLDAVRAAKELGITHVQVATNGIAFNDLEFSKAAKEAGLHTLYLQFDGLCDDNYERTRGRSLLQSKLKTLDNVRKVGLRVVFVPTVVRGFNEDQLGPVLQMAIENIDIMSGISYQPVTFTGRLPAEERSRMRITLPDVARIIEEQTGILRKEDWYPLTLIKPISKLISKVWGRRVINLSCHPHCSLATYVFVSDEGQAIPVTRFIDVEGFFMKVNDLADRAGSSKVEIFTKITAFQALKPFYRREHAPDGMTFTEFLKALYALTNKDFGRGEKTRLRWRPLLVAGMHFMDGYNYEVERVKRCIVHYSAPDGKIYPFCTYNSGPTYRKAVEKDFSIPLAQWKEQRKREKALAGKKINLQEVVSGAVTPVAGGGCGSGCGSNGATQKKSDLLSVESITVLK